MILYRLSQDWLGLYEGSCINETKYRQVYYLDRCLFDAISEEEQASMIEHGNEDYCALTGVDKILFFTQDEIIKFEHKIKH